MQTRAVEIAVASRGEALLATETAMSNPARSGETKGARTVLDVEEGVERGQIGAVIGAFP